MKLKKIIHKGVYGIIHRKQLVLFVKKARGPYQGLWDLPGGRQEEEESDEQTLIREIQEETGIKIKKWRFNKVLHHKCEYTIDEVPHELHHEGIIYFIDAFDDTKLDQNRLLEDVSGCEWRSIIDYENYTPFAKAISQLLHTFP